MGGLCWLECGGKDLVRSCVDASRASERKALLSAVGGGSAGGRAGARPVGLCLVTELWEVMKGSGHCGRGQRRPRCARALRAARTRVGSVRASEGASPGSGVADWGTGDSAPEGAAPLVVSSHLTVSCGREGVRDRAGW